MSDSPTPIICLNCFHRQRSLLQPCHGCRSRRLAHVAFLVQQLGENWKILLKADKGKVH